jgi:hypothetical protein
VLVRYHFFPIFQGQGIFQNENLINTQGIKYPIFRKLSGPTSYQFAMSQQNPPIINFPGYGSWNTYMLCIRVWFWNTLLDTHLVFVKASSCRALLYAIFFPHSFHVHLSTFFYIQLPSIKHEFHQQFHCIQCIVL